MTWAVHDLGGVVDTTTATVTLTGLSIPAGSLIVVGIDDGTTAVSGGSCTDSAGNTYTSIAVIANGSGGAGGHGFSQVFYFNQNAATVTSITYTKQASGRNAAMSAMYITGGALSSVLDTAVTAAVQGSGGSAVSVTSGTPAVSGELFVGWIGWDVDQTFTQDTANGWTSTGGLAATVTGQGGSGSVAKGAGGNIIAGASPIVYHPAITAGPDWGAFIVGFKPFVGAPVFQTSMLAMF